MSLLQVKDLSISFGGVKAVDGVSFTVEPGEVFTLVGPNGAGKSTIFNLISRLYEPGGGQILFDGQDITSLPAHKVAGLGIARTFQNIELFDHSSVLQNLLIGRHCRRNTRWFEELLFLPKVRRSEREHRLLVEEVIDFLDLAPYRDKLIAGLPYGVRKVVEIARALAMEPAFILLDEPFAGVDPISVSDIKHIIRHLRDKGIGVLITDHNVRETLDICENAYIVSGGHIIASGNSEAILANQQVKEVYLGDEFRL